MVSREILDFMLGGKKGATVPITPPRSAPSISSPSSRHTTPQTHKKRAGIVKALVQSISNWLDHDTTGYQVLQSVSNLREQIWHASQMLHGVGTCPVPSWQHFGYRMHHDNGVNAHDLNVSLDRSLLQHERMLVQLRRTMAALAISHEAMGRRLDELYQHDLPLGRIEPWHGGALALSLDDWNDLYTAASMELYRKQRLVEQVLETSVADGLLGLVVPEQNEAYTPEDGTNRNPRRVARQCCATWPRVHPESYLRGHAALLQEIENQTQ